MILIYIAQTGGGGTNCLFVNGKTKLCRLLTELALFAHISSDAAVRRSKPETNLLFFVCITAIYKQNNS